MDPFADSVATLDRFLAQIDSGTLLDAPDPAFYEGWREELRGALRRLLVWERPRLEAARSLYWPYDALARRRKPLEKLAARSPNALALHQAERFLALLPFPGEWERLSRLEREAPHDHEIRSFLEDEKRKVRQKLFGKVDKSFKLRHFLQVLKLPSRDREKGVLRVFALPYLLLEPGLLEELGRRYVFYVEPVMGVVFRHEWWRAFRNLPDPCLFGAGGAEDRRFLEEQEGVVTTCLCHGDFLEEGSEPPDRLKEYDVVFNAAFDDPERKRHDLMLEILHDPLLRTRRALFLGRGSPASLKRFEARVRDADLLDRVEWRANLRRAEVPSLLARCRAGVHLSLYENGCRAIYEFLRADLPCVIASSMAGMRADLFNDQTGYAVPDSQLAPAVAEALAHRDRFRPRRWFLENTGSRRSTEQLNGLLRELFQRLGYRWTSDIAALASSGASRYRYDRDYRRFLTEHHQILDCLKRFDQSGVGLTVE
jgi:hypothetical protein